MKIIIAGCIILSSLQLFGQNTRGAKTMYQATREIEAGKQVTVKHVFQSFDNKGRTTEEWTLKGDSTFASRDQWTYNRKGLETKHIIFKDSLNIESIISTSYDRFEVKKLSITTDGKGSIIEQTAYHYNTFGKKSKS